MRLTITYPAASLPVTLAELKAFLRIGLTVEDDVLTLLLGAACDRLTSETGYSPISTQFTYALPLPTDLVVHLPRWPVGDVVFVEVDNAEVEDYTLNVDERTLTLPSGTTGDNVGVTWLAYDSTTRRDAKVAILQLAAWLYQHRGDEPAELPDWWGRITQSLRGAFPFREQR